VTLMFLLRCGARIPASYEIDNSDWQNDLAPLINIKTKVEKAIVEKDWKCLRDYFTSPDPFTYFAISCLSDDGHSIFHIWVKMMLELKEDTEDYKKGAEVFEKITAMMSSRCKWVHFQAKDGESKTPIDYLRDKQRSDVEKFFFCTSEQILRCLFK